MQPEKDMNKKPSLADIIEELKKAKQRMYEEEEREREEKERAEKESGGKYVWNTRKLCQSLSVKEKFN